MCFYSWFQLYDVAETHMDKGRERKLSAKEIAGFALIAFAIASMIFSVLGSWYFYNWQKPYSVTPPSYPEHMVPVPPMGPTPTPALSSQDHSKPSF